MATKKPTVTASKKKPVATTKKKTAVKTVKKEENTVIVEESQPTMITEKRPTAFEEAIETDKEISCDIADFNESDKTVEALCEMTESGDAKVILEKEVKNENDGITWDDFKNEVRAMINTAMAPFIEKMTALRVEMDAMRDEINNSSHNDADILHMLHTQYQHLGEMEDDVTIEINEVKKEIENATQKKDDNLFMNHGSWNGVKTT